MTLPINPDVEVLQNPLTPGERIAAFENAIAHYALTRATLRDVSIEISGAGSPPPEALRTRLIEAAQEDEKAKCTIVAQALILMASGVLERAAEAFYDQSAGRL
ncbi:hypothetical protein KX928_12795 [Roseobacter sp. YSTF-M11]|uniref:Uncharacterized protein n=1 Tax=Roseobacter insulae TaxID=2859783 RepID=A0A9X1FVY9_9RHOB|nr:hypothetical protein [Roseobacter insulae]MBW4708663.1 hypothetical protein [Roseobacter insulae]